jgi:hypothetical protein
MVRVTRPGGRVVMGNWIPGDPTVIAQLLKISAAYSPSPPEGFISPVTWGVESNVLERFGEAGIRAENVVCEPRTWRFEYPIAPAAVVNEFRTYYGPTMNAFAAAEANGRTDELLDELQALFEEKNESSEDGSSSIPATYLHVTVSV